MESIGIICEYNPFHNGHIYHINKIKEMYKDSLIVLVMSGYFCERGEISILSKEDKTKIALENGIDIVVELPFVYSTQSADKFAEAALKLLNELKVNKIVFGSECNDINLLQNIVDKQLNDINYNINVKKYLDEGLNYPSAMAKALNIKEDISNPNDLLGISYIKAITLNKYNIEPICIKRLGDFHDIESNNDIISASNIRNKIKNNVNIDKFIPKNSIKYLKKINYDKYFELLKYKIITDHDLSQYLTVDEGIENKLKSVISKCNSTEDLINNIKTKRYTYNKINRMFIHILIGLLKSDNNLDIDYLKILGFNKQGKSYLNTIKKELNIPSTINHDSKIFEYELKAASLYDMLTDSKCIDEEIKNKPVLY